MHIKSFYSSASNFCIFQLSWFWHFRRKNNAPDLSSLSPLKFPKRGGGVSSTLHKREILEWAPSSFLCSLPTHQHNHQRNYYQIAEVGDRLTAQEQKNKIIKQALPYLALYHSKPTWPSMKWAFFLLPDPEGLVLSGWILTWGEGLLISNFSAWTGVGTFIRERDTEGFVVLPNPV